MVFLSCVIIAGTVPSGQFFMRILW